MRFLIIFIFFISNAFAIEVPDIKNITIHKDLKSYYGITFLDQKNKQLNLENFQGNLVLLNFWATWCAPCKEEMPSLDTLQSNKKINNLIILPINVGKENVNKAKKFFEDLKIKNLKLYYDDSVKLANNFSLIGLPTTILINKNGEEFARILGSIDFEDKNFIEWLSTYD